MMVPSNPSIDYATTHEVVTWKGGLAAANPKPSPPAGEGWEICGFAVEGDKDQASILWWTWRRPYLFRSLEEQAEKAEAAPSGVPYGPGLDGPLPKG